MSFAHTNVLELFFLLGLLLVQCLHLGPQILLQEKGLSTPHSCIYLYQMGWTYQLVSFGLGLRVVLLEFVLELIDALEQT